MFISSCITILLILNNLCTSFHSILSLKSLSNNHLKLIKYLNHDYTMIQERSKENNKKQNTRSTSIGQQKVARVLRDELADIICTCDIKASIYPSESLLRSVSIADIEFSSDLAFAKVHLSILGIITLF